MQVIVLNVENYVCSLAKLQTWFYRWWIIGQKGNKIITEWIV